MVILTSISMMIVIGLWSVYISVVVKNLGKQPEDRPGFSETFKNGMGIMARELGIETNKWMSAVQSTIGHTNSITIQGASSNFILNNPEEIAPGKLPQ